MRLRAAFLEALLEELVDYLAELALMLQGVHMRAPTKAPRGPDLDLFGVFLPSRFLHAAKRATNDARVASVYLSLDTPRVACVTCATQ